jgi:hypothetical protein
MTVSEALADARRRLAAAAEKEAEVFSAPLSVLNAEPGGGEWTRLQHADHLLKTHHLYADQTRAALASAQSASGDQPYNPGIFAGFIIKKMAPGKRVDTGGPFTPSEAPAESIIQELAAARKELLDWADQAEGKDITGKVIKTPLPGIRMSVIASLQVHAVHAEYHLAVIEGYPSA